MAMQKPEDKTTRALRLVDKLDLSLEEQDRFVEEMKLRWLRRALKEGEESLKRDGGIPAEVVLEELRQRAEERLKKSES